MFGPITATAARFGMWTPQTRLGVAVSGGADSVFLLHALRSLHAGSLVVLHVNHGLRGAESDADEAFVRELAGGLPFHSSPSLPVDGNIEQHCRRERLRLFSEWQKAGIVDRIATGHTATDQAETVLLRLLRGTGPTGLRGIAPVTKAGIVRPLLALHRDGIRAYLTSHNLPWRDDSSNANPRFLRNRLRAEVLPLLREMAPQIDDNLSRLAELAAEDEAYWAAQMPPEAEILHVSSLRQMPAALRRRIIRHAIASNKGDLRRIDKNHLDEIQRLIEQSAGDGSVVLPGLRVTRSFGDLRFAGPGALEYRYTEDVVLDLDLERLQGELRVRAWQPGDRVLSVGRSEPVSVKKLFQSARVPLWERKNWPIITDGVSVIWLHRFGADQRFIATGNTRNILHLQARISGLDESILSSSTSSNLRKQ